jgi:AraC family transcriptional regulator of adaptative response/methylated-DNA-[protein]-cysteine methyltransferase
MKRMAGRIALAEISAMNAMTDDVDDVHFAAVLARNTAPACGAFLYAVTTQGIFCRPGCPPHRRSAAMCVSSPIRRQRKQPAFAPVSAVTPVAIARGCKPKRLPLPAP